MANPVRPAVPTIPLDQKFVRIVYNGTPYHLRIDLDLNSTNFLKVTEMRYSPSGSLNEQKLVAYPTDNENKAGAKPWGGPMSPTGGLGKAGTLLFKDVISSTVAKQAVANELSSLYGTVKPNIKQEWQKSADKAGTNDILIQVKPGPGLFEPKTDQQPLQEITPGDPEIRTDIVVTPDAIKELQDAGEEAIQSLFPNYGEVPRVISYPDDASYSNSQDHVIIEQFSYKAPQELLFTTGQNQFTDNFADIITGGLTRNTNLKKFIGMVKLPIPNQLGISNGVSWGEDRANPIEAAAFFGALPLAQQAIGGNVGNLLTGAFSGFGQLLDKFTSGQGFSPTDPAGLLLSSFIAQYALGKVGINVDPAQFIARGTGTTINPNLELLFNGPKLRTFSFSFEFAPNGVNDAKAVRRVMRFFKEGMAANRVETTTIFIGSPNVFRVSYRGTGGKQITGLNRFKICALLSCEVNYTPDGVYQSYDDPDAVSMPVRSTMTLTFQELTPIFSQDYRIPSGIPDPSLADVYTDFDGSLGADPISTPDDIGF
jgi:hypothetical protein